MTREEFAKKCVGEDHKYISGELRTKYIIEEFGAVVDENGAGILECSRQIDGHNIVRKIAITCVNGILDKVRFTKTTYIDNEEVESYVHDEFYPDFAYDYLVKQSTDWSEYVTMEELNAIEKRIVKELKNLFPSGEGNFRAQFEPSDLVGYARFEKKPFSIENCARYMYNRVPEKYRDDITGLELRISGFTGIATLNFLFKTDDFENAKKAYIADKSDWCSKYGCD